jgi:hypothetical protein
MAHYFRTYGLILARTAGGATATSMVGLAYRTKYPVGHRHPRPPRGHRDRTRPGCGEVAADGDGFGDGGQGTGAVPASLCRTEVVQRPGQVGQEDGGVGRGEVAVGADGFGDVF